LPERISKIAGRTSKVDVRRCGVALTSLKLLQGCSLLEARSFGVRLHLMAGCYIFSCDIPPCFLVMVTHLILLSHPPALRVMIIRRLHLLDSMWLGPYVFSHDIYISLLISLCLYSRLSHACDHALPTKARAPDVLSSPLATPICEPPDALSVPAPRGVGGYPSLLA